MRLTPADVHNVAFKKPSIGKRGYDEDEVDAFLDLVEAELSRLIEENNELTLRLSATESGQASAPVAPEQQVPEQPVEQQSAVVEPAPQPVMAKPEPVVEQVPQPEPTPVPVQQAPAQKAPGTADHHVHAARLLGLAEETAQRLTDEAAEEAEQVRSSAKAESEALLSDAKNRSEQTLSDAKNRSEKTVADANAAAEAATRDSQLKAEAMDREAQRKYGEVMTQLTEQRTALEKKIDDLRTYEREYRSRLKGWITEQLSQLDEGNNAAAAPQDEPARK
ncbi:DivIVA domain-containing protein [Nakamurella sp. A5-74]|uniref:Cell wall synthesis protein Wag31 n=1 Tax=Nakamurella sp. A5-74 TaxID=3158264 RepID=A0AAU8DJP6_9ACTN